MNKKYLGFLFSLALIIFFSVFSAAVVSIGNPSHEIEKQYTPGQDLIGWMNISLQNEPADSLVVSSLGGDIKISELLDNNYIEYTCTPFDCLEGYAAENGETTKSLTLDFDETENLGLKISGDSIEFESLKFTLRSNAQRSCTNQITLDLMEGALQMVNTNSYAEECASTKSYGCYKSWLSTEEVILDQNNPYCEKIKLPKSPGFKLGAWIKKVGSSAPQLSMTLYQSDGTDIPIYCDIPYASVSTSGNEVSCLAEYPVLESGEYYVCLSADYKTSSPSSYYKIKKNKNSTAPCGFYGTPGEENQETTAYQIFAVGVKYDAVGAIDVVGDEVTTDSGSLNEMINSYIQEKYNGNCANDCIIPLKIKSNIDNQGVILSNLELKYLKTGEGSYIENNFYDVASAEPVITLPFTIINLDSGGFGVGSSYGEKNVEMKIGTSSIFTDKINVLMTPEVTSLTPLKTSAGMPTDFVASVETHGKNITNFEWNFGDGSEAVTTLANNAEHTYSSVGIYELKIEVVSGEYTSYKVFNIQVGSPEEAINVTLAEKKQDVENLKVQIESYPEWEQSALTKALKIDELESDLRSIQTKYSSSSSEEEFTAVMESLVALSVPKSINITKSSKSVFFPDEAAINIAAIAEIGGGEYDPKDEAAYKKAVYSWDYENLDINMEYKQISAHYKYDSSLVLNVFQLDVKPKNAFTYEAYLVFDNLENLKFKESYNERPKETYSYISLNGEEQSFSFSTTEDVNFENLPAFAAPQLSRLPVSSSRKDICNNNDKCEKDNGETRANCSDCRSWWLFIFLILLLLVIAFVVYTLLQEWYKRRYEKFLFKNQNELYNIVNYVHNSKKQGMNDLKIAENLRKSGWKKEQIDYVLKKYSGRETGMKELPVKGYWNRFKAKLAPSFKNIKLPKFSKNSPTVPGKFGKPQINVPGAPGKSSVFGKNIFGNRKQI